MLYDGNGRVTQLIDDRGAATLYAYDTLNRQISMTFVDGSVRTSGYNLASDVTRYTDENGSLFINTFDALGRKVSVVITPATAVQGTTAQGFEFDGLSRRIFAADSVSGTDADVTIVYDSMSRVLEESQVYGGNTRNLTHDQFISYALSRRTLPSSTATHVTETHDALYRLKVVGGDLGSSSWRFMGNRVIEQLIGDHLICTQLNNARTHSAVQASVTNPAWGDRSSDRLGYDGSGRMITKRVVAHAFTGGGAYSNTSALVGFTTAFDPSSNKLYERALHAESRSSLYPAYDSPDRLREYQRGVLASGGATVATAITLPGTKSDQTYDLDGLGNWKNTTFTPVGSTSTTQIRQHNYLNEVTKFGSTPVLYDHGDNAASADPLISQRGNGNIIDDGTVTLAFDALNRLTTAKRKSDAATIAVYTYDAFGRRIRKVVTNGGVPNDSALNGTTDYLYDGARCIEERNGSNAPIRQFAWGQYIDECVAMQTLVTLGGGSLAAGYYSPLSDLLYRSTALTNDFGAIVEAYDTDAYGNTIAYKTAGTGGNWFADDAVTTDNPALQYIFTGRQDDPETTLYYYRARYYQPRLGRFVGRDIIGYAEGTNLYRYARSNPPSFVDPNGLAVELIAGGSVQAGLCNSATTLTADAGSLALSGGVTTLTSPGGSYVTTALTESLAAPTATATFSAAAGETIAGETIGVAVEGAGNPVYALIAVIFIAPECDPDVGDVEHTNAAIRAAFWDEEQKKRWERNKTVGPTIRTRTETRTRIRTRTRTGPEDCPPKKKDCQLIFDLPDTFPGIPGGAHKCVYECGGLGGRGGVVGRLFRASTPCPKELDWVDGDWP